ncbi:MAG: hypothetical protein GY807_24560 [Gammaproteobacteria bacterium]|nr:hypothetical protein [Gammaproteobacteria bacterium]
MSYFSDQFDSDAREMMLNYRNLKYNRYPNPTDFGTVLESLVTDFLAKYLPQSLSVARGYIVNDRNNKSRQQDVIIYDPYNYTLMRDTNGINLFPIESVYCTVEVKSCFRSSTLENANKNAKSVKKLSGTTLLIEKNTGYVDSVDRFGSTIFSTIFTFDHEPKKITTCASHFFKHGTDLDYGIILNLGCFCYIDKFNTIENPDKAIVKTTTAPDRDTAEYMILRPKEEENTGFCLAMWIAHIVDHSKEYEDQKGKYNLLNYIKIPESGYEYEIVGF